MSMWLCVSMLVQDENLFFPINLPRINSLYGHYQLNEIAFGERVKLWFCALVTLFFLHTFRQTQTFTLIFIFSVLWAKQFTWRPYQKPSSLTYIKMGIFMQRQNAFSHIAFYRYIYRANTNTSSENGVAFCNVFLSHIICWSLLKYSVSFFSCTFHNNNKKKRTDTTFSHSQFHFRAQFRKINIAPKLRAQWY